MRNPVFRIAVFCILLANPALAQTTLSQKILPKHSINKAWITSTNPSEKSYLGVIYQVCDSALICSSSFLPKDYMRGSYVTQSFACNNISFIQIRSSQRISRGFLIGAAVGATIGILSGFASGDDPAAYFLKATAKEKAGIRGVGLGILGGTLGIIIGSIKIGIPIYGSKDAFNSSKKMLLKYSIN
ncbi:MAG: hypothetical protein HXX13_10655 [Bacteroidetes bacterium]|nr:hypothetical protein [Bacteroidota bacterium]